MTDSNLPVWTLFTDEKSLIVHKHWTTVTTRTALIPFCLATLLSLSFFVFDRPLPFTPLLNEMQELRAMTYHHRIGCKACVYMVVHIQ